MYKNWAVVKNDIVKDKKIKTYLLEIGYTVAGNIGNQTIENLKLLFGKMHNFKTSDGGMFYSLYSNDLTYRKTVHEKIKSIMQPTYDTLFENYKTVINSFIVKLSGPKSDFTLHQDSTGLDEFSYSPLSVWIPLQDTNLENGTLCVIPKTHSFFHPYRGISFSSPFKNYENLLRRYLVPINLKAGDIFLFDNRLVHYSHLNNSDNPRVVVMSGIFPTEAEIISVYKDENTPNSPIEIYKQTDDFLVTNTAFYENCTARPYRGEIVEKINEPLEEITAYDFLSWASKNNIEPTNIRQLTEASFNMQIVSEPV